MKNQISRLTHITAFTLLIALTSSFVQAGEAEKRPATISISASGTSNIAPDLALINLSVVREAKTARAALDENTKAMAGVLKAMRARGIEERDLQTSNFSINPKYFYSKNKDGNHKPPRIVGYRVNNALSVRIRDLSTIGDILDLSVTLGVNQGGNIHFSNDDPSAARKEARKKAMARAIEKATTLTEAAGVKIGRVISISEQGSRPVRQMKARMAYAEAADSAPVPVASGENSYTINVNVSWEIDQ